MYSREGLIVEYMYKGEWKHVNCVFGYLPRLTPPDGEMVVAFVLKTIYSSNVQNLEPGEITADNISHVFRVFEWYKSPDELEVARVADLQHGFQVCVVNEELYKQHGLGDVM